MRHYEVILHQSALDDLRALYETSMQHWSYRETEAYVQDIERRITSLETLPHRFAYDQHTKHAGTIRSFSFKAHKVFFTISDAHHVVNVIAILPSRTRYDVTL